MPDSLKKQIRARMKKTGESRQTAHRNLVAQRAAALALAPPAVARERSIDELLALLHTPSTFAVLVGRIPAAAGGANFELVMKQVHDLARNPKYYAKTGGVDMVVSLDEHNRLIAAGAIDDLKGEIIRSHRFVGQFEGLTFSDQCKKCDRWIWCGETNREASCICGHPYRMSFDLVPDLVWGKRRYARCMDCGTESAMHPVGEGYSPWRARGAWQFQCNKCYHTDDRGPAPVAATLPPVEEGDRATVFLDPHGLT